LYYNFKKIIMDGLYVKNGRLINDRQPSESGIAKACSIKKSVDRERKVSEIADGIERAEMRKSFRFL